MTRPIISSSRAAIRAATSIRQAPKIQARFASGGQTYNEPSGYLFGEKPPPKGQKRVKEDWENIWYYGFFGSMFVTAVLLYYKPDSKVQTWATEEARKRLDASGENWKYQPSPNSGYPNGV